MNAGDGVGKKALDISVIQPLLMLWSYQDVFTRLTEVFPNNKVAGFARVIMLNTLQKYLPPLVVLQATCNTFTHEMVREQWEHL